jgi:hypothetical protein
MLLFFLEYYILVESLNFLLLFYCFCYVEQKIHLPMPSLGNGTTVLLAAHCTDAWLPFRWASYV